MGSFKSEEMLEPDRNLKTITTEKKIITDEWARSALGKGYRMNTKTIIANTKMEISSMT